MDPVLTGFVVGACSGFAIALFFIICVKCCGFGSGGVRGDSYAALLHSNIGDVERGSCFACCQSFGALCTSQLGCVFIFTIVGGAIGAIVAYEKYDDMSDAVSLDYEHNSTSSAATTAPTLNF